MTTLADCVGGVGLARCRCVWANVQQESVVEVRCVRVDDDQAYVSEPGEADLGRADECRYSNVH